MRATNESESIVNAAVLLQRSIIQVSDQRKIGPPVEKQEDPLTDNTLFCGKFILGFHSTQETQKTIDIAAMLVFQTKEIIKILLLRVHQHGRHDVR